MNVVQEMILGWIAEGDEHEMDFYGFMRAVGIDFDEVQPAVESLQSIGLIRFNADKWSYEFADPRDIVRMRNHA